MDEARWAQTNTQLLRHLAAHGWTEEDLARVRRAHVVAAMITSGFQRSTGRPVLAHVVGVADALASFGYAPSLVEAALVHTALGRGTSGVTAAVQRRYNRGVIRRYLGVDTLRLIERFSDLGGGEAPAVHDGQWSDPDCAALQLVNIVEELDTSAEFLSPRHRRILVDAAQAGARQAKEAGDPQLAELLTTSAARAEAVEASEPSWLDESPGLPVRVSVGWFPPASRHLTALVPASAVAAAKRARGWRPRARTHRR